MYRLLHNAKELWLLLYLSSFSDFSASVNWSYTVSITHTCTLNMYMEMLDARYGMVELVTHKLLRWFEHKETEWEWAKGGPYMRGYTRNMLESEKNQWK